MKRFRVFISLQTTLAIAIFAILFICCSKSEPIDYSSLSALGYENPDATEVRSINVQRAAEKTGLYIKIVVKSLPKCDDKPKGDYWFCKVTLGAKTGININKEYWQEMAELRESGEPFMLYGYLAADAAPIIWVTRTPPSHLWEYLQ